MRSKRRIFVGIGVGAAAVVLLVVELAVRAPLPDVTVVPVTRQTLESWVSTNGTVQPKQAYLLQSRLDTFVTKVGVLEGQAVRKGQPLLSLDSTPDTAQLAQAHLQLLTAERQLQDARAGGPPDQVAQLNSELTKAEASRDQLAAEQKALEQLVASRAATQDEMARNGLKLSQAEADVKFYQQQKNTLARQAQFSADQGSCKSSRHKQTSATLVRRSHRQMWWRRWTGRYTRCRRDRDNSYMLATSCPPSPICTKSA